MCFPFAWTAAGACVGVAGAGEAGIFTDGMGADSSANIPAVAEARTIEVKMRIFFMGKIVTR